MSKFTTTLAAVAATTALFAVAAPACDSLTVPRGDLDLSRPADAQTFKARVAKAAAKWCRTEPLSTGSHVPNARECRKSADEAVTASLPKETQAAYLAALKQTDAGVYAQQSN